MRVMRRAWLILISAVVAVTVPAQGQQSPSGIVIGEFSMTASPWGYKHDISVESGSIATIELRNNSEKTITAYVPNYTFTHGAKTDYYDGHGKTSYMKWLCERVAERKLVSIPRSYLAKYLNKKYGVAESMGNLKCSRA